MPSGERITVRVPDAPGWSIVRAIDGEGWDVHGPDGLATWRRDVRDAMAAAQLLCARAARDEALARAEKAERKAAAFQGWRGHEAVEHRTNLLARVEAAEIERDEALAEAKQLREECEWQGLMTKGLLPYQERAVKAETALDEALDALGNLIVAVAGMPDAGLTDDDPRRGWWMSTAPERERAREVYDRYRGVTDA